MNYENKISFIEQLLNKREAYLCNVALKNKTTKFVDDIISLLFPHFSTSSTSSKNNISIELQNITFNLKAILDLINPEKTLQTAYIVDTFIENLPTINTNLWQDANEIYSGDPAAESIDEVILAYPGFMAIAVYRIANILYKQNVPIIPRIMSEYAHQLTGVDIHPGAEIDSPFFIDHGTGIVIGETTKIGKHVKLYQGVTLGALSVQKSLSKVKRHPTINDNVVIYAQAVILGGNTIIGSNSIIGGNTWVTHSIPENSIVLNQAEIRIRSANDELSNIDYII